VARPASPEASACARIWAVDRGTGASQRPGSLPALRVACRYSPVVFDRQHRVRTFFNSIVLHATALALHATLREKNRMKLYFLSREKKIKYCKNTVLFG